MSRARILTLAALLALPLCVSSSRASTTPLIVFSADRAPTVTGEIYRLDPNGHRVDLSKSPFQDTNPAVSPDGKHVAFFSDRGNTWAVYEVGINGRGLHRLGPAADVQAGGGQLTWQPHGRLLAVSTGGRVWLDSAGRKPVLVAQRGTDTGSWSQDGRVLLLRSQLELDAVAPSGRELWHVFGWNGPDASAWSPHGLLAISVGHGAAIYDESGRLRLRFGLPTTNPHFAWSPDGNHLAVSWSGPKHLRLEVRTSSGRLVLEKNVPGGDLGWAGNFEVVAGIAACSTCRAVGADVRTGKLSPASSRWLEPLSPDRKLAIVTRAHAPGFMLGIAPPGGGPTIVFSDIGRCLAYGSWLPAVSSLQFAGRSRSIVYQSWNSCDEPFSNLYAATPGGEIVRRLTNVEAQETQPAISPDGSQIAYVWAEATGISCSGCSDGIRIATIGGADVRTLTNPQDCVFDDSPTWSPDGSAILYAETGCDSPGELYTIPAGGGTAHDLGIPGNNPAWGPSRIAYVGSDQADVGLWTANPDGSGRVRVAAAGRLPAWSADGRLAYLVGSRGTTVVAGSTDAKLPFAVVKSLSWSPDGTQFVVVARAKNAAAFDVYTVRTDGADPVRLTRNYGALGASW